MFILFPTKFLNQASQTPFHSNFPSTLSVAAHLNPFHLTVHILSSEDARRTFFERVGSIYPSQRDHNSKQRKFHTLLWLDSTKCQITAMTTTV